jgi:hypothetical protein
MELKYRIRKRSTNNGEEQYYVDYKRINEGDNVDEVPWMGGFYSQTLEKAKTIIENHREYETLRLRLQMDEEVIYDETGEKHD